MPSKTPRKSDSECHADQLFENLRDQTLHLRALVLDWVKLYKRQEKEALHSLLVFILQSCGLKKDCVSLEEAENEEMESILEELKAQAKECEEYPLISKNRAYKGFYSNFQFFWVHFVNESGDCLYDQNLLNFLTSWLASLSFSGMRPIRHTSTASILSLGQGLVDMLVSEEKDLEKVQSFLQTETEDSERLDQLKDQEKELQARIQVLHENLDSMVKDVVSYRFKDVMPEIRSLCVQSLGYLAEKSSRYLNDQTLKYLGLMLYDKSSEVREHILSFLARTYSKSNCKALQKFIKKNKPRLVEMCNDIENKCCVEALKVCTLLCKSNNLSKEEEEVCSCLLWAESEEIRLAASEFVLVSVFNNSLPKKPQDDLQTSIFQVVNFFHNFGDDQPYRIELLVKSFWNKTCIFKCWDVICELLKKENKLANQRVLVLILVKSLKHLYNSPERRNKTTVVSLSSTLISELPNLLTYYRTQPEVLCELVKVPLFLDLTALAAKDLKQPFKKLVTALKDLNLQSSSAEIIMKTAQSLGKLAREPHALQKEAQSELTKLIDDCLQIVKEEMRKYVLEGEQEVLEVWLRRTSSLITVKDILDELGEETLTDILGILGSYLSNAEANSELANTSAEIVFHWHLWSLNRVSKNSVDLEDYLLKRTGIIENLTAVVAKQNSDFELRKNVFKYLGETLMVVSGYPAQGSQVYLEVSSDIWSTLEDYMTAFPIVTEYPKTLNPTKAKKSTGAVKEDADSHTQLICLIIGRLVCSCPSITVSQLPSSFFAHYGYSSLRTLSIITKQVLNNFKTKDLQSSGPFSDPGLIFNIILESLIKCMGKAQEQDITNMKELTKKFVAVLGSGPMPPKQAQKYLGFLIDGISFSLSEKSNLQLLDALSIFVGKNYLSPSQMQELYDRVSQDSKELEDTFEEESLYSVRYFLHVLGKNLGLSKKPQASKVTSEVKTGQKRQREEFRDEDIGVEEPFGRPRKHTLRKKK